MIHRLIAWAWGEPLCLHRSHRLRVRCYQPATYDHQCGKHNSTRCNGCGEAR